MMRATIFQSPQSIRSLGVLLALGLGASVGHGQILSANFASSSFGEYPADGSSLSRTPATGLQEQWSIAAVDSASATLGKSNLPGTTVTPALLAALSQPVDLAGERPGLVLPGSRPDIVGADALTGAAQDNALILGMGKSLRGFAVVSVCAIPENSTCAFILGAATLGLAIVRRRSQRRPVPA